VGGIHLEGVSKRFGAVVALHSVDLHVEPGEVVALLGANGAGKSTLVRIGATTVIPDSGRVEVGGWDALAHPTAARSATGVVLNEERSFYWRLSGRENLEFFAALHGLRRRDAGPRVREALADVDLVDVGDRRVDRYSSGMRARLGIARALLGRPEVLLLDEPGRGLDPIAALDLRRMVLDLAERRRVSVLFVTHDLHEAAAVATRVVVIAAGRVGAVVAGGVDAAGLERAFLEATVPGNAGPPTDGSPASASDRPPPT
jgi:ABC-2 type transport system ATP-binding protein